MTNTVTTGMMPDIFAMVFSPVVEMAGNVWGKMDVAAKSGIDKGKSSFCVKRE